MPIAPPKFFWILCFAQVVRLRAVRMVQVERSANIRRIPTFLGCPTLPGFSRLGWDGVGHHLVSGCGKSLKKLTTRQTVATDSGCRRFGVPCAQPRCEDSLRVQWANTRANACQCYEECANNSMLQLLVARHAKISHGNRHALATRSDERDGLRTSTQPGHGAH